jgi:hypothetical protein
LDRLDITIKKDVHGDEHAGPTSPLSEGDAASESPSPTRGITCFSMNVA